MRLRCIHSCVLALVLGLLLIYSTFLTAPLQLRYVDTASGEANATVVPISTTSVAPQPSSLVQPIAQVINGNNDSNSPSSFVPPMENTTTSHVELQMFPISSITSIRNNDVLNSVTPPRPDTPHQPVPAAPRLSDQVTQGKGVITHELYESGFLVTNRGICPGNGEQVKLLILVTTAPGHEKARQAIRLTWGHFALRRDIGLGFFVGRTLNTTLQQSLDAEQQLYSDLIQGNFIDSYDNLTLKTLSMLEWTREFCPKAKFILKTDDDMFIHVPNLLDFVDRHSSNKRHIYGRLALKWKPVRNHKSKYYVSLEQYRQPFYPDFTTGPAYLLTNDIISELYTLALDKKYLKLEDVYTTGIVAHELKIKRVHVEAFANKKISLQTCKLQRVISLHMIQYHEQFDIWKKVQDGRIKCK